MRLAAGSIGSPTGSPSRRARTPHAREPASDLSVISMSRIGRGPSRATTRARSCTKKSRLSEKYRLPVLLCDLQGKTQAQAAHELNWGEATVRRRLPAPATCSAPPHPPRSWSDLSGTGRCTGPAERRRARGLDLGNCQGRQPAKLDRGEDRDQRSHLQHGSRPRSQVTASHAFEQSHDLLRPRRWYSACSAASLGASDCLAKDRIGAQ